MTYCSFIRDPRSGETFASGWSIRSETAIRERLAKLSKQFYLPYEWGEPLATGAEAWENVSVSAGYTYLAQFLAHDCVHSNIPTACLGKHSPTPTNYRSSPLALETLYGGGPDGCAHALRSQRISGYRHSRLRLGRMRNLDASQQQCPFRDIPRTRVAEDEGSELTVAVLADDRNDNNAIVSQLTVLFAMLHNAVADLMEEGSQPSSVPQLSQELVRFDAVRQICVGIYRRVVRNDLLRALLHPAVYERYCAAPGPFVEPDGSGRMPLEFALAMRFGHAMVRPHYRINSYHDRREQLLDVLLTNARGRPWRMPLDESWMVQWSRFFAVSAQAVNHSRRIGPCLSTDLLSSLVFDRIDETNAIGVLYRDLIFGALVPVPTISALIAHLETLHPGLVESSPLLSDDEYRIAALRRWLEGGRKVTGLSSWEIDEISRDPPLVAFILLEAALEASGRHLGALGSFLIAEPIFSILANSTNGAVNGTLNLPPYSSRPGFSDLPFHNIKSMADLILFVAERQPDAREIVSIV